MLKLKYELNVCSNGITLTDNNGSKYRIIPTSGDAGTVWFRILKSSAGYDCMYIDKDLLHDVNLIIRKLRRGKYEKFIRKIKKAL